jgi:hypothetical protein
MAMRTTQNTAAYTALAVATSAAITKTIAWTGGTAPAGVPNSMIDTTWTVLDDAAVAIPFSASYDDLDTTADQNRVEAIVARALGMNELGVLVQADFAAAAVAVAAAAAEDAPNVAWDNIQGADPDIYGIET